VYSGDIESGNVAELLKGVDGVHQDLATEELKEN
jgi:hypothetical protein